MFRRARRKEWWRETGLDTGDRPDDHPAEAAAIPLQFGLRTLLVVVAVNGASLGLMRAMGLPPGLTLTWPTAVLIMILVERIQGGSGIAGGSVGGASFLMAYMTYAYLTDPRFEDEGLGIFGSILIVGFPLGLLFGGLLGAITCGAFWITGWRSAGGPDSRS